MENISSLKWQKNVENQNRLLGGGVEMCQKLQFILHKSIEMYLLFSYFINKSFKSALKTALCGILFAENSKNRSI